MIRPKWSRWQLEVNIRRVGPCPGHQSAEGASISKDPPQASTTAVLYKHKHQPSSRSIASLFDIVGNYFLGQLAFTMGYMIQHFALDIPADL